MKKLGKTVTAYIDEDQAAWLDEKVEQGYKKAGIVRLIISQCMSVEEVRENPVALKRLLSKASSSSREQANQTPEHTANSIQENSQGKLGRPKKDAGREALERQLASNRIALERYKKEGLKDADLGIIEAEATAWVLDHPLDEMPEDLYKLITQYHIERWKRATGRYDNI